MHWLKKQSIFFKVFLLFVAVALLSMASHTLVAKTVQKEFLRKQAKSISRQIVLTRKWIATQGGVWSKNTYTNAHGYLVDNKAVVNGKEATYYLHNPALATREISSLASIKHGYDFRVVSDEYREPKNKPDVFEAEALQAFKGGASGYYDTVVDDIYRYTEPLYVAKGCLKCHGDLEQDVKEPMKSILLTKYGNRAFGYKVGDVRGVISVRIPKESLATLFGSIFGLWNYLLLVIAIVLFYLFSRIVISRPVQRLTDAAVKLSKGKLDIDLGVQDTTSASRDEFAQLAVAFERLKKSFQILAGKLAKERRNPPS